MALAVAHSRGLDGLQAPPVLVEAHLASGLPAFTLVGLPDTEVKEARDRVRAAIVNSGFEFPQKRITVNLAPADLPKESGRFDLPIALGILAASGQIPAPALDACEFAGELSLSGELRPIRGALAMALQTDDSGKAFILPEESAREAALTGSSHILAARSLLGVCAHLSNRESLPTAEAAPAAGRPPVPVGRARVRWAGNRLVPILSCRRRGRTTRDTRSGCSGWFSPQDAGGRAASGDRTRTARRGLRPTFGWPSSDGVGSRG